MKEKKVRDGRNRVVSQGFGRFCKLKRSGLIYFVWICSFIFCIPFLFFPQTDRFGPSPSDSFHPFPKNLPHIFLQLSEIRILNKGTAKKKKATESQILARLLAPPGPPARP